MWDDRPVARDSTVELTKKSASIFSDAIESAADAYWTENEIAVTKSVADNFLVKDQLLGLR